MTTHIVLHPGSGKPDPNWQEGDPVEVWEPDRIACWNACKICNPKLAGRMREGHRPINSLAYKFLLIVHPYRFERTGRRTAKKILQDGTEESISWPDLPDRMKVWLSKNGHRVFWGGRPEREIWFDTRWTSHTTPEAIRKVWQMLERETGQTLRNNSEIAFSDEVRKALVIVDSDDAADSAAARTMEEEELNSDGEVIYKRTHELPLIETGVSPTDARDRSKLIRVETRLPLSKVVRRARRG